MREDIAERQRTSARSYALGVLGVQGLVQHATREGKVERGRVLEYALSWLSLSLTLLVVELSLSSSRLNIGNGNSQWRGRRQGAC